MKLTKAAKLRLFGKITKWSSDKIRFNRKAINDLIDSNTEITADDITPELLENEDIITKINNWGLTDEEIENLCSVTIDTQNLIIENEEDVLYKVKTQDWEFEGNDEQHTHIEEQNYFSTLYNFIVNNNIKYIKLITSPDTQSPHIFKIDYYNNNIISFYDIIITQTLTFLKNNDDNTIKFYINIGIDTL